jgi:hypothetical protein
MNSDSAGMLTKRMHKPLTVLALYFASASMSALAAVYELPANGLGVVGTNSRIRLSEEEKVVTTKETEHSQNRECQSEMRNILNCCFSFTGKQHINLKGGRYRANGLWH